MRLIRRYGLAVISCFLLLGMQGQKERVQAEDGPFSTLKEEVETIADEDAGDISVFIETSDGKIKINETEVMSSASVIKVPILVEVIRKAEQGNVNLDEKVRVYPSDIVGGGGVLKDMDLPQSFTVRRLAEFMITVSDNSASNLLLDRVGMDDVNQTCIRMGCVDTVMQRYLMDLEARRHDRDNLTTAKDMVTVLKAIDKGDIVSHEGSEEMLRIMRDQKLTGGLPAYKDPEVHEGIQFALKGGTLGGPKIRHNVAIVTLDDLTVYVAVLTKGLSKDTAQSTLAEIGESIMDYLVESKSIDG